MKQEKPVAVLCMGRDLNQGVYSTAVRSRIAERARLVDAPDLSPSPALAEAEVLLTSWGTPPVTADVLAAAPRLRVIIHAAGTVKTLITPDVFDRGIAVSSAAAEMAELVAVVAHAFVTLAAKKMLPQRALYQAGGWTRRGERRDIGFTDKTIGLVGGSRIGAALARRLVADGRRVVLYDPYWSTERAAALGVELVDLDDLMSKSQIVSLHAPNLDSTYHMIDRRRLALMPDGASLINTARGRLVDTEALLAECASGRLDALLDVTDPEPLPPEHGLQHLPNVFITPHLAGNEGADLALMGMFAAEEMHRFLTGAPMLGAVRATELARLA